MTRVVFETAALADALTKAAKVAPTRGDSFEKSAGIVLQIAAEEAIVLATDTLVRYSHWLTPEQFDGEPVMWRLPSRIFSEVVGKLKPTTNRHVTLEQDGSILRLQHGRTKATFMLMDHTSYPYWTPFSPDAMHEVDGLAKAIQQVMWACAKNGDPPMIGVYLDGHVAVATDRYKFASTPCVIKMDQPVTIPPHAITSILRPGAPIMMRTEGNQIYIMPDDYTQIALTAYGVPYPAGIENVMIRDWPIMAKVSKSRITELAELVLTMTGSDRMPTLILIFGGQKIVAMVENEEVGRMGDVMDVPEQLDFPERIELRFNPENFLGALSGSTSADIMLGFDPSKPRAALYVHGGDVEFWIAPRQKTAPGTD